jgi:hypothetical protein
MFKKGVFLIILFMVFGVSLVLPKDSLAALGDYAGFSFDTAASGMGFPAGIAFYNGFFWITDPQGSQGEVYKYNPDGTYTGVHFDTLASGAALPYGIVGYNGFLWIADVGDSLVYQFSTDGTYTGNTFSTAGSGNAQPYGMTFGGSFFWIVDVGDREVYKYNPDGTYTGISFDTNSTGLTNPIGITYQNDNLWIADPVQSAIYQFETNGTYSGFSFDTAASGNSSIYGLASYDGFFWSTDSQDDEVYKYVGIPDIVSPTVVDVYPADNSVTFDVNSDDIYITFNEDVEFGTGYVTIYKALDDSIVETLDVEDGDYVEVDNSDVYFYLTNPLESDTEYYIQIDATAFDDTSGNSFAGIDDENTWNFRTYDDVNPMITSLSPEDNENKINTNSDLVITFDEAVSIDEGYITIYKSFDDSQIEAVDVESEQVGGDGTSTITINLNTGLDYSTDYYIFVGEDAFYDENDNYFGGINDESVWNFTTRSNITSTGSTRSVALPKTIPAVPLAPLNSDTPLPCINGALFSNITGLPCSTNEEVNTPSVPQNEDSNKFIFTKSLWTQIIDPDVKELQKYLNTHGYPVALVGPGSLGNETEKFGNLTRDALIKFQIANDINPAVGFFGPITRAKINGSVNRN